MKVILSACPSRGSYFHCIPKQRRGCVVEHLLAMQTTRFGPHTDPKFFIILFAPFWIFRSCKDDFFRSQPTMPIATPTFLRSELFNAIALKNVQMQAECSSWKQHMHLLKISAQTSNMNVISEYLEQTRHDEAMGWLCIPAGYFFGWIK